MKKTLLFMAAAMVCMFGMTSCDGETIDLNQFSGQDILGHITLVVSEAQEGQPLAEGDTVALKSAMCDATFEIVDGITVNAGSVFVGTASDIVANGNTNINYPLCGINLRDTLAGTHAVSCPVTDFSAFEYARTGNWAALILGAGMNLGNVVVLAMDEDNYFLGYQGSIEITEFSSVGSLVKGQINNLKAFYITKTQMEALWAMSEEERSAITPINYFQSVTLNGEISSRRANMEDVLNSLEEL